RLRVGRIEAARDSRLPHRLRTASQARLDRRDENNRDEQDGYRMEFEAHLKTHNFQNYLSIFTLLMNSDAGPSFLSMRAPASIIQRPSIMTTWDIMFPVPVSWLSLLYAGNSRLVSKAWAEICSDLNTLTPFNTSTGSASAPSNSLAGSNTSL